jgi:hypothetical protein
VNQLRTVTGAVAHDLKSPVSLIRGTLESALCQEGNEKWREPYWQDDKEWLCTVGFLPTDDPEAGLIFRGLYWLPGRLIAVAIAEPDGEIRSLGTIPNRAESIRKLNVGLHIGRRPLQTLRHGLSDLPHCCSQPCMGGIRV